jgi:hypothetical protein
MRSFAWMLGLAAVLLTTAAIGGAAGAQGRKGHAIQVVSKPHFDNGVCTGAGLSQPAYGSIPPTVPLNPTSVDLVWTPGLNDKVCKSVQVRGNTGTASKIARDIDHAAPDANAAGMFCLADDGTRVLVYFGYQGTTVGPVIIQLSGCGWVYAAGSEMRQITTQLRIDLLPLTPLHWKRYLEDFLRGRSTK